jgi:surfactin synthase thioesterase subunit
MIDRWIVFGGWALHPQILQPLFGSGAVLIDSNEIMPDLVRNNELTADWQKTLTDRIIPLIPADGSFGIAGWSTGSLLAYACANQLQPERGAFISATPSFCRRPGFSYGWKPAALKAMREQLASDPERIIKRFYLQCGIATSSPFSPSPEKRREKLLYNEKNLIAGLFFLEQADILPVKKLPYPALFFHGKSDTIIPCDAGKYFCNEAGGTFIEYEGPHAFFINHYNDMSQTMKRFVSI